MTVAFSDMPKSVSANDIQNVKQDSTSQVKINDRLPAAAAETKSDTVELSSSDKKEKKGPIKTVKSFIANIKKFFASAGEYTKGTVKGLVTGAAAGSVIYTAGSILKHFKPESKVPNKALAVAATGVSLAANLWNASLNATERSSEIEHRWTGHQK